MASVDEALLEEVKERYQHAIVVSVADDGYPLSAATGYTVDTDRLEIRLNRPAGSDFAILSNGGDVNVVFSHIHPQEGVGYDQRRYVSLWGTTTLEDDVVVFSPDRVQSWDEDKLPFFEYSEVTVPQAHRYMEELGERQGRKVRPRLDFGWLALRTTRAPFLSATLVPVLVGIAVAALHSEFSFGLALLTVLAASFVHLGLNISNDVFDTLSGADAANTTPTQFSGGSRVVLYGLLSVRQLAGLSATFYAVGLLIGLYLALVTDFWPIFTLGVLGLLISVFYTAPPVQLVYRGLGEIAVFLGFGPIMLLGAYWVQAERFSWEALYVSLPIGILIALILYVNEIPDRAGDGAAGKRTLPVRWSRHAVISGYRWGVATAFTLIGLGAIAGVIARPALIALASIPLAVQVIRGLQDHYDNPYALMPAMAKNVALHGVTGLLLLIGYVIAIIAGNLMEPVPGWLS